MRAANITSNSDSSNPGMRLIVSVLNLLGLKKRNIEDNRLAVHSFVMRGLPNSALIAFYESSGLHDDMLQCVHVSRRTFQRMRSVEEKGVSLSPSVSSHLWKAAEIYAQAIDVFGTTEKAKSWLSSPALALNGERPVEVMTSVQGAELVSTVLDRIDTGVYT